MDDSRRQPDEPEPTATYGAVRRDPAQQPPPPRTEQVREEWPRPSGSAAAPAPGASALDDPAYERFGGVNVGAAFFGWMVAVGSTVLLSGIVGAVVLVLGLGADVELDTSRALTTSSVVSAAVVLVVLLVAYYCGGYVAGRMSRFDGGRQGVAVWVFALVFGVLGGLAGYAAGERYDLLAGADLPSVEVATSDLALPGIVTGVVVLLGTLVAAAVGGKVGRRYHAKVDRAL